MVQCIKPSLLRNIVYNFEILCGKCKVIVSLFTITTVYLSSILLISLLHINTLPVTTLHISLYRAIHRWGHRVIKVTGAQVPRVTYMLGESVQGCIIIYTTALCLHSKRFIPPNGIGRYFQMAIWVRKYMWFVSKDESRQFSLLYRTHSLMMASTCMCL